MRGCLGRHMKQMRPKELVLLGRMQQHGAGAWEVPIARLWRMCVVCQ